MLLFAIQNTPTHNMSSINMGHDNSLYFGFKCEGDVESIIAAKHELDNFNKDDWVSEARRILKEEC